MAGRIRHIFPVLLLMLALVGVTGSQLSGYPLVADCELYGSVSVWGQPAAAGTRIEAFVGGVLIADTVVITSGSYEIAIPADDPVTLDKDGWLDDDVLTLVVDGETAHPPVIAFEGRKEVSIAVQLTSDVRRTTWGKIKALFR